MKKHMDRLLALLLACALTIGDCVPALAAQPEAVQAVSEAAPSESDEAESEQTETEADVDESKSKDVESDDAESDEVEAEVQLKSNQTVKAESATYSMDASPNQSNNVIEAGNSYTLADGTEFQFTPSEDGYYYVKPSDADKEVSMEIYETETFDDGSVDSNGQSVYGDQILIDSAVQEAFWLKAGDTYSVLVSDDGDSTASFGFYKAEDYQAAYKLVQDQNITIPAGSMGFCKIEGEPGSLLYISFSKEVSLTTSVSLA